MSAVQLKPLRILRQPTSSALTKVRSMAARLPPELCDMIIDFLYDEKPVLSICTLVCRAWLRAARYHLFDSIYVHCEKNLDAFHDFLAYLQSTPSVRAYIKDLCLDGFTEVPEPPDNMESCYLAAIAELLPQIHTMSVINCQWGPQKNDVLRLKQIPLRSLYINSFVADNEIHKDKFRVLRQFSHIGHLHLANVWLGHFALDENETDLTEQGGDTKLLPSTRVKALSLSMANICLNFLECLRLQSFVGTLSSLRIIDLFHAEYLQEHQDLMYVGELLRGPISTSLLELHLELPRLSRHDTVAVYESVDLSHCTALTSIYLRMPRRCEAHALEAEAATQDQSTQVDEAANQGPEQTVQPPAPVQVEQGTQTEPAASETTSFNDEEWKAPAVLLSRLPSTVKSISLDVELEGTDVQRDLTEGMHWREMEVALLKLPQLEKVSIRKVKERYPFVVQWTKGQHDLITAKLPALRDKRVLCLHWPPNLTR